MAQLSNAVAGSIKAGCAVSGDSLWITAVVPIVGVKLTPVSFDAQPVQHGQLTLRRPLGAAFVHELSELTGTRINLYVGDRLSGGDVDGYHAPALAASPAGAEMACRSIVRPLRPSM